MTRDEYYQSTEFKTLRLLNKLVHDVQQLTQRIYDVLELVLERHPSLIATDHFSLFERQLHIVNLEARRLQEFESKLTRLIEPNTFDDMKFPAQTEAKPDDAQGGQERELKEAGCGPL